MSRSVRHDALIDAVVELVTTGDVEDVSMETVAERAGVSRPLVYKHFANRGELLAAAYRREATALHDELAAEIAAATTLIDMYRALVRGAFRAAVDRRDGVFAALRSAGARNRELRQEQRLRDVETVRAFSAQAVREYRLGRREATAATVLLLGAIEPLITQWRLRPTPGNAALLEEIFIRMVNGGYAFENRSLPHQELGSREADDSKMIHVSGARDSLGSDRWASGSTD
jgi:AcrR family transcriptional regulator